MIGPFFVSALMADATIDEVATEVDRRLSELIELIPDIALRVEIEGVNRILIWRGYLGASRPLGVPDIEYGYCEVRRPSYEMQKPVEIRLYSNHPDYVWLWKSLESSLRTSLQIVNDIGKAVNEPWLLIPDHLNDRLILDFHWQGLTASQIEARTGISIRTIYDTLRIMRKKYGNEIVPFKRNILKK